LWIGRKGAVVRREWDLEELIECWTLDEEELALLANKSGATRLGFGLMLKFFELEARFPRREDVPRVGPPGSSSGNPTFSITVR
jgi:hypothetical protein